jgi:hypothetical protein
VEGNEVTDGIPHMEKPNVLGMDGVGPMALIDGKEDITETPPMKHLMTSLRNLPYLMKHSCLTSCEDH